MFYEYEYSKVDLSSSNNNNNVSEFVGDGECDEQWIRDRVGKLYLTPTNHLSPHLFKSSLSHTLCHLPSIDITSDVFLDTFVHLERIEPPFNCTYSTSFFDYTKIKDYNYNNCINELKVHVERGGMMGDARTSSSMQRRPERYDASTRGTLHSVPFDFGGLTLTTIGDGNENKVNMTDPELKKVAPGLSRGLGDGMSDILNIGTQEFITSLIQKQQKEDKNEGMKIEMEEKTKIKSEKYDEVDDLLVSSGTNSNFLSKKRKKEKTWAHLLDTNTEMTQDEFNQIVPEPAKKFPFELDTFQKYAAIHLERGECVFVAAHTSAGKTVVAEYAIALAQKHMTRTIYTSPIKALSNQKFRDFRQTFGDSEIGLLTGDVQIRPESPCVIMTTEILRSMLYKGADMIRDVEFVIFDEVHYINDLERGVVWEEVIIMLPSHITIILLSATVPNTVEFADWVGRTKKKNVYVISTQKRPVPLEHYLFVSTATPRKLYKIVEGKDFLGDGYKRAWDSCHKPREKAVTNKEKDKKKPTSNQSGNHSKPTKQDKNIWLNLCQLLTEQKLLPVVIFTFSKKKCEEFADSLSNLNLLSAKERSETHVFIEKSLSRLKGPDKELPQLSRVRELLQRGIAVHHGGLLPIVKELVEILFSRNLVKVLFATETFAMGVNMPARSVVFSSLRKHDGRDFRDLLTGEYIQMSGRAGRRGLDAFGVVIIACSGDFDFPESTRLQSIILGQPTRLQSQFKLTYNMILNLLRVQSIKVEDMMKQSFAEDGLQKSLPVVEEMIKNEKKRLETLPLVDCSSCKHDIDAMYWACFEWEQAHGDLMEELFVRNWTMSLKVISAGRLLLVKYQGETNLLAAVVSTSENKTFSCLLLRSSTDFSSSTMDLWPLICPLVLSSKGLHCEFVQIPWSDIRAILNRKIKVGSSAKDDPNSFLPELNTSYNEILKQGVIEVDLRSLVKTFDFQQNLGLSKSLIDQMKRFQCKSCREFQIHWQMTCERNECREKIRLLEFETTADNLQLLPDYEQRLQVLRTLNYVDDRSTVQLKGRVACELNSGHSLVLTEILMENVFNDLDEAECAALLSAFVFQERMDNSVVYDGNKLSLSLQKALDLTIDLCDRVAETQIGVRLPVSAEDFLQETLNFGLVQVVYEWARGMSFKNIMELNSNAILEGSIVRTITRLDELCREVRDAARVIGNATLYTKMDQASMAIKRDIVFAASLYV